MRTQYEKHADQMFKSVLVVAAVALVAFLAIDYAGAGELHPCADAELVNQIWGPFGGELEKGCVYELNGPLEVKQAVVKGGYLVGLTRPMPYMKHRFIALRMMGRKGMIEGDAMPLVHVVYKGPVQYPSKAGRTEVVHAFEAVE